MLVYIQKVKNDILEILENNRTKDVSGQELAERLRVTRAAVWKAVKVLKADGHSIEAVRNRGYRLSDESDIISREGIKSELKHSCDVMVYRCVDSTNTTAKLAAVGGAPAGTVIIAEMQTSCQGQTRPFVLFSWRRRRLFQCNSEARGFRRGKRISDYCGCRCRFSRDRAAYR